MRLRIIIPRGIGVISTLHAIYGAAYGDPLVEWRECRKAFWDGALRGSSALRMGLLRNMRAEAAVFAGHETLTAFSDFETFYDTVGWAELLDQAEDCGFPLETSRW